jgi:hypothetical protein
MGSEVCNLVTIQKEELVTIFFLAQLGNVTGNEATEQGKEQKPEKHHCRRTSDASVDFGNLLQLQNSVQGKEKRN